VCVLVHGRTTVFLKQNSLTISLRFMRFPVYNVYITNQFQNTFARGGGGGGVKTVSEVNMNRKEEKN
jgi:hypothetical protein